MPCILKVHVGAARGLPAIDKTSELADAYVEIRFADADIQRTSVCRKTLNPVWNKDFRFEISDDTLLQDEPLELKVFDFDAISADDSVGTVTIDLNPLLSPDAPNQLAGWFPIYDTIKGARGELRLQVKLEFFENTNPFKDSSAGVHIFANGGIPPPYTTAVIVGLVDAVITEVDPDYHWSDSFRTSRSSNEASQRILNQMSCRLRRQMGRKALEMGGDAILSYCQWIDIEPYAQTITVRGLGTAAILNYEEDDRSNEDLPGTRYASSRPLVKVYSRGVELATLTRVPSGSLLAMGGVVSAKSVKLMSEETDYGSAQTRDRWLSELREEIRTHARNLGCNIILGYRENIAISDNLYTVYAEGTACRIRYDKDGKKSLGTLEEANNAELSSADESHDDGSRGRAKHYPVVRKPRRSRECQFCHLPRRRRSSRWRPDVLASDWDRCNICKKALVADLLLATLEIPMDAEVFGEGRLVESYICRPVRKKRENDVAAHLISVNLPFVEYDLYRQLQFKVRYHGFNAVFGLRYQFIATDKAIIAIASGTAVCLAALPKAKAMQISRNIAILDVEDRDIFELQERIAQASLENRELIDKMYEERFPSDSDTSSESDGATLSSDSSTSISSDGSSSSSSSSTSGTSDSDRESIVQIDDEADEDLLLTMIDYPSSASFAGTSDALPPLDIYHRNSPASGIVPLSHFVCQFRRFTLALDDHHPSSTLSHQFCRQYEEIAGQLLELFADAPVISCVRHQINIVRGFEVQLVTTATAMGHVQKEVRTVHQLLEPIEPSDDAAGQAMLRLSLSDTDDEGPVGTEPQKQSQHLPHQQSSKVAERGHLHNPLQVEQSFVHFSTCSSIPSSVFSTNCGMVTLQLFKEVYYHECSGGFPGFVASVIADLFAIARASATSLGGCVLTSIAFKPAPFYENFKNQLHAVVFMTADVISVDLDHPHSWSLIQLK